MGKFSMTDRFDLEEAIGEMAQFTTDIDTVIYAIGDAPERATEDELLNMLIGMKQLQVTRYQKMWRTFEGLIKNGTISNKGADEVKMPPYDDGSIKMEASD